MATFLNNLRLKEINTGDESGTWGASTNVNLELIGQSLGYGTKNMSADSNTTFTMADGVSDQVRSMHLKITSGVALTATREVTLGPNTVSKFWIIENATTGGQSITIKQGSGTTVTIANGDNKAIYTDGIGAGANVKDSFDGISIGSGTFASLNATSANIDGGTIDGAALGGSSAITALTLSGNLDVSGGTIKLDGSHPVGTGNVVVGFEAGNAFTGSNLYSVAIGYRALKSSSSGSASTAVGSNALENNTVIGNCAFGGGSLTANTTGQYNTGLGTQTLALNVTGEQNTAVGFHSLEANLGSNNTGVGTYTLESNTTGERNIAIGSETLQANTTQSDLIAIGYKSMDVAQTGTTGLIFGETSNFTLGAVNGSSTITVTMQISGLTCEMRGIKVGQQFKIYGNRVGGIGQPDLGGNINAEVLCGSATVFSNKDHTITSLPGGDQGNTFTFTATDSLGNPVLANALDTGDGTGGNASYSLLTDDSYNISIGNFTGMSLTSGGLNTIIGHRSGRLLTTGKYNTHIGQQTGELCTDAQRNTFIGPLSGCNTTSSFNTFVGAFCGLSHDGSLGQNLAIGAGAYGGDVGLINMCMGVSTMLAGNDYSFNICIGDAAGYMLGVSSTGSRTDTYNCFIGMSSGRNTDVNFRNTFVGQRAGKGDDSLDYVTGGSGFNVDDATALGYLALGDAFAGADENTAIGSYSLNKSNGANNTAIGFESGKLLTTGANNTFLGYRAADAHLTGSNNTVIGYNAEPSSTSISNQITLGDSNITALRCNVTTISSLSDMRDKDNVENLSIGMDFVNNLRPVQFDWNRRDGSMPGKKDIGFIAQELDEVQNDFDMSDYLDLVLKADPDRLEASYAKLLPVLVKAIQELSDEVKSLKEMI